MIRGRMSATDTALLVVDVQEKLIALIPERDEVIQNIAFLIDAAQLLELPILATEQYPKGLGGTVSELADKLPQRSEKMSFSCAAVPDVAEQLRRNACPKILIVGIETHVCIQQTALEFRAQGTEVFVSVDAVASRYARDHEVALRRMETAGVVLTTSEAAVFEWTGGADCPQFKGISRLVRERMAALSAR